jgi:hypothetical protein
LTGFTSNKLGIEVIAMLLIIQNEVFPHSMGEMPTLLLIYSKNTFIIAVEGQREKKRENREGTKTQKECRLARENLKHLHFVAYTFLLCRA